MTSQRVASVLLSVHSLSQAEIFQLSNVPRLIQSYKTNSLSTCIVIIQTF